MKLYVKDDKDLKGQVGTVKTFCDENNMEVDLDKCTKVSFNRSKQTVNTTTQLNHDKSIKDMDQKCFYMCLGGDTKRKGFNMDQ